jgi:hypothetical protein
MENKHIRLDYAEVISARKQLLSSELNLVYLLKRLNNYKNLRKKEFLLKSKLKSGLYSLKSKLKLMGTSIPEESMAKIKPRIIRKMKNLNKDHEKRFADELNLIKEKLAKLEQ